MKVNAWTCAPATDRDLESGYRKTMSVRTRKMVNAAREGQRQVELWWRLQAMLMCKLFVALGFGDARQTKPSHSWFPQQFPSG